MLQEALAALASTGGTALVTAMVTDEWEVIKARFARLLGRGDAKHREEAAAALDKSRAQLVGLSGTDLETALADQEIMWRTRLIALLERNPEAEGELRAVVSATQARRIASEDRVQQHVVAFDEAQQAVQGHGVQTNTFGSRGEPGTRR